MLNVSAYRPASILQLAEFESRHGNAVEAEAHYQMGIATRTGIRTAPWTHDLANDARSITTPFDRPIC